MDFGAAVWHLSAALSLERSFVWLQLQYETSTRFSIAFHRHLKSSVDISHVSLDAGGKIGCFSKTVAANVTSRVAVTSILRSCPLLPSCPHVSSSLRLRSGGGFSGLQAIHVSRAPRASNSFSALKKPVQATV